MATGWKAMLIALVLVDIVLVCGRAAAVDHPRPPSEQGPPPSAQALLDEAQRHFAERRHAHAVYGFRGALARCAAGAEEGCAQDQLMNHRFTLVRALRAMGHFHLARHEPRLGSRFCTKNGISGGTSRASIPYLVAHTS